MNENNCHRARYANATIKHFMLLCTKNQQKPLLNVDFLPLQRMVALRSIKIETMSLTS